MTIEVGSHDEPVPADAEPMGTVHRLWFRTGTVRDPRAVLERLTMPKLLPSLHPLITRVDEAPERRTGAVRVLDFTVFERVPLVGRLVQVPNRYRGRVSLDDAHPETARCSGWSAPGVRVELRYDVVNGRIDERAWVSAPWWVAPLVVNTFTRAHRVTLAQASAERPTSSSSGRG